MPVLSLKTKTTLVVFLLVGTVLSAVAGLGLLFFISEFKENIASRQLSVVSAMAGELDDKIAIAQRELVAVARSVPPRLTRDPAGLQRFLDGRLDLHQVFGDGTSFFSPDGALLAFSPGQQTLLGQNFSGHPYFSQTIQSGKPCISEPTPAATRDGHPIIVFTAPVYDEQGKPAGLLGGRVDLMEENLLGRLARLKVGEGGEFFLFNKQRQIIVQRDQDGFLKGALAPGKTPLLERALAGFQGSGETSTPEGEAALCSFTRLKSTGWILGARLPLSEAYAPIERARCLVAYSLALALPLALVIVWWCVGGLTAPLLKLSWRVAAMGGEEGGCRPIPEGSGDEIGMLAHAFNQVMGELCSQRRLLEKEKAFTEQLLTYTAVPTFVIDAGHRVLSWNRACEELTGIGAAEVVGGSEPWRGFYPAPHPVLADIVVDGSLHLMADLYECYADSPLIPDGLRAEGWFLVKGRQRFLSVDAAPILDAEGQVIAAVETLQDVTVRASTEEQLREMVAAIGESEERFRRLVELSQDGIAILVKRRFVFINPAGCEMLGYLTAEELLGREMREYLHVESAQLFEEQLCYAEQSGSTTPWIEERLCRRDLTKVEAEVGASPFVFRGEGALQVIFRDITERKLAKARLESLAHYDSLTSLPNRVLFFDRLRHAVGEAERHRHALALMFLDLDRFKNVNDTLGHAAGDAVLVEAGRRLKDCVRACDLVARMGGDEFTVILSKMADELDAALVAERIIQALSLPFQVEGKVSHIGASIGICVYPSYGTDLDGMVRQADLALYRAKQDGRNGYCFYGPELGEKG